MKCVDHKILGPSSLFVLLLLLVAPGCTKEELVEPQQAGHAVQAPVKSTPGGTVAPPPTGTNSGSSSPISDDGDDLGDGERPKRPKN